MSAFKFPPPPPPPPKLSNEALQPNANQRGGYNRGRGDRGGAPRGSRGRGGGNNGFDGGGRGGRGGRGRGGARGGHSLDSNVARQNQSYQQQNEPISNRLPVGAYVNPSFVKQSQADPNALASVTSLAPRYSPPQHAGQKRKLNDRHDHAQPKSHHKQQQQQKSSKPPRAKAAVAPPIPSFGFALPPPPVVRSTAPTDTKDNKKRKANLGLTQQPTFDESSSEDEDVDEEAAYAEKLKDGGFAFEHEGDYFMIRTAAEMAAWRKDRRKNFPTQKRIAEKAEEAATKRVGELNFLRKLRGQPLLPQSEIRADEPSNERDKDKVSRKENASKAGSQANLAALRKRLHESMIQKNTAPSAVDLGLGYGTDTDSGEESSILSESSVVSSSEESEDDSDEESDDDAPPEATSSKIGPPPINVPPPAPAPVAQGEPRKRGICESWVNSGRCRFSNKCKFEHPPKDTTEPRKGLFEVMVEQELVKGDELVLAAIKYLGQNGFLG